MPRLIGMLVITCTILVIGMVWEPAGQAKSDIQKMYVGSDKCATCHQPEYDRFKANSRKAQSYKNIVLMKKGLTEDEFRRCLECHTTGFGKPGGFRSEQETPNLKDAGCEVCHGPGSVHVQSSDPKDIKKSMSPQDCEVCHNAERIEAFHFKPLMYGGAH